MSKTRHYGDTTKGVVALVGFFGAMLLLLILIDAFERHPVLVVASVVMLAPAVYVFRKE